MPRNFLNAAVVLTFLAGASARADLIRIEVTGTVDFNVIQGSMVGVQRGDPVVMSFNVDSNVFVNSPTFPTRGYVVDLSSFAMTVAGRPVPIVSPQPAGQTAYFVLRNNDPAVDGFLLSTLVDFPRPVAVTIPGLTPIHELDFLRTFNSGTALSSLNILDALGTYGTSDLSVFNWTIGRFGNPGAGYNYQSITLSNLSGPVVVPEPASMTLLAVGAVGLLALARRRNREVC